MDIRPEPNPPPRFGASSADTPESIEQEKFDRIAADAETFEAALTEDIALSKETILARNRLFISSLLTIITLNSDIQELTFASAKVKFAENVDLYISYLAILVTAALWVHYAAAAFSEYLAEALLRDKRSSAIKKHQGYLDKAIESIENLHPTFIRRDKSLYIKILNLKLRFWSRKQGPEKLEKKDLSSKERLALEYLERLHMLANKLKTRIDKIRWQHKIGVIYSIMIPVFTLFAVVFIICLNVVRLCQDLTLTPNRCVMPMLIP